MKREAASVVGRRLSAAIVTGGLVLGAAQHVRGAWEFAHADVANRGFVNVATAPAGKGSKSVPGLGTFAPGAGPVIAPDGTVYLGTLEGKLVALRADGGSFWSRDITPGQAIVASPAIAADGSVYVVGTKKTLVRDHRDGKSVQRTVFESTLHKFTASGGSIAQGAFPVHGQGGAFTSAPPNIVRIGSLEVVLVPAVYDSATAAPGNDLRLIGFSTAGNAVLDQRVVHYPVFTTGGSGRPAWVDWSCLVPVVGWGGCLGYIPYNPPRIPASRPPLPGVAIFTFAGGGAPFVIVTDQLHTIVGYTFSAKPSLTETFRVRDESRKLMSPPMVLPNGHTLVGAEDGVVFAPPNGVKLPALTSNLGAVRAAPTLLADGRAAVVDAGPKDVGLALVQGGQHVGGRSFAGRSIASATASRTHIFVSTADAFYTLDTNTLAQAAKIDLIGGGLSTPAIGPQGHVYTIASDILFVFPPPSGRFLKPSAPKVLRPADRQP